MPSVVFVKNVVVLVLASWIGTENCTITFFLNNLVLFKFEIRPWTVCGILLKKVFKLLVKQLEFAETSLIQTFRFRIWGVQFF